MSALTCPLASRWRVELYIRDAGGGLLTYPLVTAGRRPSPPAISERLCFHAKTSKMIRCGRQGNAHVIRGALAAALFTVQLEVSEL